MITNEPDGQASVEEFKAVEFVRQLEAEAFARQILNPLCVRLTRRVSVAAARSPGRGMRTLTYVDFESGRFAILGVLPLVAAVLAEWEDDVDTHYFGPEDQVFRSSAPDDQAYGSASPLVKKYRSGRIVWQVCADDDDLEPTKPRVLRLRRLAEENGAEFSLFNSNSFRSKKQRFWNSVLLNNMSQAAPTGRFNFYPEESAIRRYCAESPRTCLLELQELPNLDVGKVQGVVARMIRTGRFKVAGRGDPLNQKGFSLVTPLEWHGGNVSHALHLVKSS
ncbi:hypothetical protein [Paraburkholderia caledonica]|uniref:hypothetical protein n=1 Tax=Paraburkholderia caledonica TaxID=134536 RepID=UPI000B3F78BE|nr:hypothetical protein [Paraburkholderia caledonica]